MVICDLSKSGEMIDSYLYEPGNLTDIKES